MEKENFLVYRATFKALKRLTLEQVGKFILAYGVYSLDGTLEETGDVTVDSLLDALLPIIDSSNKRYNACVENGKKGGRPKTKNNQTETKDKPNNNQNGFKIDNQNNNQFGIDDENLTDTVTDTVTDNEIVPECNNTRKQKEYDGTMTVDTSTSSNNQTHNVEKEKEQYDVNILPVTEGTTKKSKEYYIKCFEEGCGKGLEPTVDQITGFVVKNNVSFDWKDFELNVYDNPIGKNGDKVITSLTNLGRSGIKKLRPMKVKVEEGGYGYSFSSDTKSVQEFMKMYVESDKHQDLNIIVENNN